jgi:hypothetical protein
MTEAAEAAEASRPRFTGLDVNTSLLIPKTAQAVPPAVRDASTQAQEALDTFWEASRQLNACRAERETAAHIDRSADRAAVAAGVPMPTKRAEAAAQAAFAVATRKHDAALGALTDAQRHLATEIYDAKPTWIIGQEQEINEQHEDIRQSLSELVDKWDRLAVEHTILAGLRRFDSGSVVGISFGQQLPKFERMHAEMRQTEFDTAIEHARLWPNNQVAREFNSLVGALLTLVPEIGV